MKTLHLSDEIYRATAELLKLTFRTSGTRQPDGTWLVPIADHLWGQLERERRPDETDDEVFMRLVHEAIADIKRSSPRSDKGGEYRVHAIESLAGQAVLAARGLSTGDLEQAVAEFEKRERSRVRTVIGVNDDGLFGSKRSDWRPDQPDAFAERLLFIPWVQILEYLGRVPEGTTGKFLESRGKGH